MVLFSFSNRRHIPLIICGEKAQTTRVPRKTRKNGAKPYSVGEKAQLYYRSRVKDTCINCIKTDTKKCFHTAFGMWPDSDVCCVHSNFFGESVITEIYHYWEKPENNMAIPFAYKNENWMEVVIGELSDEEKEEWAIADGFVDGYGQANDYFFKATKNPSWAYEDLDVIVWDGAKIVARWADGSK